MGSGVCVGQTSGPFSLVDPKIMPLNVCHTSMHTMECLRSDPGRVMVVPIVVSRAQSRTIYRRKHATQEED
jgi:hypothetical protein